MSSKSFLDFTTGYSNGTIEVHYDCCAQQNIDIHLRSLWLLSLTSMNIAYLVLCQYLAYTLRRQTRLCCLSCSHLTTLPDFPSKKWRGWYLKTTLGKTVNVVAEPGLQMVFQLNISGSGYGITSKTVKETVTE